MDDIRVWKLYRFAGLVMLLVLSLLVVGNMNDLRSFSGVVITVGLVAAIVMVVGASYMISKIEKD